MDESLGYEPVIFKKTRCPHCGMEFYYIPGKESPHAHWVHYEIPKKKESKDTGAVMVQKEKEKELKQKAVEEEKQKTHVCPRCQHKSVKRVSSGIWKCKRCDLTFASGAYSPVISKTTAVEAYKPMEDAEEEANV